MDNISKHILFTSISICAAEIATIPLDTIKTHIQSSLPKKIKYYDSIKIIYKNNRIFGFYNSFFFSLARQLSNTGIKLALYPIVKKYSNINKNNNLNTLYKNIGLIGVGTVSCICSSPFEVVKIRLQSQSHVNKNYMEVIYEIYKKNGFLGFFRGIKQNILRHILMSVILVPLYDKLNNDIFMDKFKIDNYLYRTTISSFLSTIITTYIIHPIELIKTQIMNDNNNKNTLNVFNNIFKDKYSKRNGILLIYKGIGINIFRCIPHFYIVNLTYETLKKYNT